MEKETYILKMNGEAYGSPFSSRKTLNECVSTLKRFDPAATFTVDVYVARFDGEYEVLPDGKNGLTFLAI